MNKVWIRKKLYMRTNLKAMSKTWFSSLLNYLIQNNYQIRLGEAERAQSQQEIYVKQGKSKTSNSMHLKRCAVDLHKWLATIKRAIAKHRWLLGKLRYKQQIGREF